MEKLSQLFLRLQQQWGISWLKNKTRILGSVALGALSAAIVYLTVKFTRKKSVTINISDVKRRIDRDRQEQIDNLIRTTKRIETREDILKELNRNSHFN